MAYKQRRPLNVTDGGTGATSFTSGYAPIVAGVSPTAAFVQADTGISNIDYVLTSNGSLSIPEWKAIPPSGIETVQGDTGAAQSGPAITLAGGSTGLSFGGASNTLTTTFAGITANGGTVSLATDATTSTINVGTGSGVKTTTLGSTTSSSTTTVRSGSGALNVTSTNGALTINSGTGTIGISSDATATTVNIGTGAGNKTTTIGSSNTTSTTNISGGTGGIQLINTFVNLPATTATTGQIRIGNNRFMHSYGTDTTFLGSNAGNLTNTSTNTVGIGLSACASITTGINNIAVGVLALNNLTTGSNNVCIGGAAGLNLTLADSNNIIINNISQSAGTNNSLVIGQGTGTGTRQLNSAFICGITGISVTGSAVIVSSANQLGVTVSSMRYKENIEDMGDASSSILTLRPAKFNYNFGEDRSQQTGLIAEEVEQIMPSLVVYNSEGIPDAVKYHELPALLLNELQKAVKRIEALEAKVALLES